MSGGTDWLGRARHLALGGAITLGVVLATAALSTGPAWQSLPSGNALLRLSFTHSGVRNCRDRTTEELAKLPKNMRNAQTCDRRRAPVHFEMDIDGKPMVATDLAPSGLAGSGPSRIYQSIELPAGEHSIALRMRDDPAVEGFTQEAAFDILLAPSQSLAIDYDSVNGRFFLH